MPLKSAKPCGHPGCPALTHGHFCEKHKQFHSRASPAKRGYGRRWRAYRILYLQIHPLCVNFNDCRNVATVVDHIIPVNQGESFWEPENHEPMCEECHNRKTAAENGGFGNRLQTSARDEKKGRPRYKMGGHHNKEALSPIYRIPRAISRGRGALIMGDRAAVDRGWALRARCQRSHRGV